MKNYIKYLFFFVIFVVTLFVGCSYFFSKNPEADIISSVANEGNTSGEKKQTLVFCYGGNDLKNSLQTAIIKFEEANPDVAVKTNQLPSSTNLQKDYYASALYSGDSSIDVFLADIVWTAEFSAAGWLLPLDIYFDKSVQNEFIPVSLENCKYKGRIYAIPGKIDVPMLYYRSDIISVPPKTNMQLIQLSQQYRLNNRMKYGYVFTAQSYEGLVCVALEFIWNNGGIVIEDDLVTINSPESIEGLQQLVDIVNSDVASMDVLNFQEEDARIAFQDNNALFMRNWPYAHSRMAASGSGISGKYAIAPLPIGPNGNISRGTLGGFGYMINSRTKNRDLAGEFIRWMTSYETQYNDARLSVALPARKKIYDDTKLLGDNLWFKELKAIVANSGIRPVSPSYSAISESMQINFNNAVRRRISAKAAIENIESNMIHIRSLDKEYE